MELRSFQTACKLAKTSLQQCEHFLSLPPGWCMNFARLRRQLVLQLSCLSSESEGLQRGYASVHWLCHSVVMRAQGLSFPDMHGAFREKCGDSTGLINYTELLGGKPLVSIPTRKYARQHASSVIFLSS